MNEDTYVYQYNTPKPTFTSKKHSNGSKYDENGCYCIKYDVISELYTVVLQNAS